MHVHGGKERTLKTRMLRRAVMVGMLLGAYGLGYLSGAAGQRPADAQGIGGVLENLDTLRKVQSALTGR
jgi:hypothetical protein